MLGMFRKVVQVFCLLVVIRSLSVAATAVLVAGDRRYEYCTLDRRTGAWGTGKLEHVRQENRSMGDRPTGAWGTGEREHGRQANTNMGNRQTGAWGGGTADHGEYERKRRGI